MDFGLAEGDADAEDGALSILPDPDGDENGAVQELAALADLFVSGIQDHVGIASQRAIPPGLEFDIELGGAGADQCRADGMAAEFLDDFVSRRDQPWTVRDQTWTSTKHPQSPAGA